MITKRKKQLQLTMENGRSHINSRRISEQPAIFSHIIILGELWIKFQYDYSEVIPYSSEDKWFELNTFWSIDKFADMERVRFLRYWDKIYDGSYYCVDYFVILDETHLAYGYIGGYYLLERFQYCDPTVSEKI